MTALSFKFFAMEFTVAAISIVAIMVAIIPMMAAEASPMTPMAPKAAMASAETSLMAATITDVRLEIFSRTLRH